MSGTSNLTPQNYFATSLSSGITATDTTIFLASLPTGSEGYLEIDEGSSSKEIIYYTSKGSNFVTLPSVGAGRGVGGTAAVSHLGNATVKMKLSAEWWLNLQDGSAFKSTAFSPVKTANPYKFGVYRTSAWTDGNGAYAKVQFDTKEFDTGTNFDVATNFRFIAPVTGFYFVSAVVAATVSANSFHATALYKNGVLFKQGTSQNQATGPQTAASNVSVLLSLTATDYLEIFHFGTGGAGAITASQTYFSGFLVSTT